MFITTLMIFCLANAGKYSRNQTLIESLDESNIINRKFEEVQDDNQLEIERTTAGNVKVNENVEGNSENRPPREAFSTSRYLETTMDNRSITIAPETATKSKPMNNPNSNKKTVDSKETKRKPIKLNMKQGLLMNQVLAAYALDDARDPLCRNHSIEFKDGLRSFEPWALKMFDSSSKLQSGILVGNLMEFGSFKQCINIYADSKYGAIHGQQCTLKITPTSNIVRKILGFRGVSPKRFELIQASVEGASLYWSVCLPDSCNVVDILRHFTKYIKAIGDGLDLNVTLHDIDCFALKDQPPVTIKEYAVIALVATLLVVTVICTLCDLRRKSKDQTTGKFVQAFSFYSNAAYVFRYSWTDSTGLACLNGIRFLSITYVIIGHRFLMTLFVPAVNSLELMEWLLKYSSTVIIGGTVSVDTFFMISGLLVAYHTMEQLSANHGKLNWFLFYLHRYVRLTPPLAFVVLIHATVIQHIGSGPMWTKIVAAVQKPCQYFWWSTILHIQNYVNPKYICILQTWYLTCDMMYYLFSPLVIYPLWKYPKCGWFYFAFVYALSIAINFYFAWVNEYGAGMLVTTQLLKEKFFIEHYIAPHVRSSPFILGVGLGAVLQKTKHTKIKMNPVTLTLGWLWSSALLLVTILSNHTFQLEDHQVNLYETSFYLSMSRSAWTMGVMWIVWACKQGYGGPIDYLLSHPIFQVLGKVSYSMFLWHMTIQFLYNGALKLPIYFSDFSLLYTFLGDLAVSFVVGLLFTILVECPSVKIARSIFSLISLRKRTLKQSVIKQL